MEPQHPFESSEPKVAATEAHLKGREIAQEMREAGEKSLREAAEQGKAVLGQQKEAVAETFHHCSDAFRRVAKELDEKQDRGLSACANILAERLDRTSEYLKRNELQSIRRDVEHFARNKPQLFFGGLFLAGLALARFFKASSPQPEFEPEKNIPGYPEETFGAGHGPYGENPASQATTPMAE